MKAKKKNGAAEEEPSSLLRYRMEIAAGKNGQVLLAEGVKRVLLCREDLVRLAFSHGFADIEGRGLQCCTYAAGCVELYGTVLFIQWKTTV